MATPDKTIDTKTRTTVMTYVIFTVGFFVVVGLTLLYFFRP